MSHHQTKYKSNILILIVLQNKVLQLPIAREDYHDTKALPVPATRRRFFGLEFQNTFVHCILVLEYSNKHNTFKHWLEQCPFTERRQSNIISYSVHWSLMTRSLPYLLSPHSSPPTDEQGDWPIYILWLAATGGPFLLLLGF